MARLNNTIERKMFYGASPITFERASQLRKNQTEAEKLLWEILKNKQMLGFRFRRQHPIGKFIADFYCHKLKLIIEVDGSIHLKPERAAYDLNRTAEIERLDMKLIRFTNEKIIHSISEVKVTIEKECKQLMEATFTP